tara:strand:+ start:1289 stop:1513 length:225 start_codon:yes stop_codon:yes gene_type:complete
MRVREKELYVGIAEVRDFMSSLGIQRGFEQDTIRKKMRKGKFKVPYIRVGLTKYFKKEDLIRWLEEGMQNEKNN